MNKKILSKILATILVLMLTFSNVIMLAVYAAGETLENQQTSINKTKIEFDAYFKTEDKKVHSMISDINAENLKLYISIKLTEGSLNNAVATLSNSNFKFKEYKDEQGVVQSIDLQNNKIYFNGLGKETNLTLEIPIEIMKDNKIDTDYFKKESKISLSGEYLNNLGGQVQIEKEIKVLLQIHGEANAIVEQSIDKYVPFNTDEVEGILLQSTVKAGIENNNLPIKQVGINIEVPVINNVKPTNVVVVGKEYTYNNQTGILNITATSNLEDGQISWTKNGPLSYKIIYLYGQDAYTSEEVIIKQKVQTVISVYNDEETQVNKISDGELKVTEKINDNVTNTVSTNKLLLYKGFLYNNSINETTYQTTWKADIGYTNLTSNISLTEDGDKYIFNTDSGEEAVPNYAYYKATYIEKENFERILGLDGYIDILDTQGNKIGTINKDSTIDENNNYVFNYVGEIYKIIIKTSKPLENLMGEELVVKNDKAIKSSTSYNLNWLKAFTQIKTTLNHEESRINLGEIETKVEAAANKNNLSTAVTNNVEFTVALLTDSAKYQLYKNPMIDIKLPYYVQNVELGNVDVLYGNNELSVASKNVYKDNDGNKIIRVILNGEQTDYELNSASRGTNLFVSANITTNKFMPSQEASIEVTCTNMKDNSVSNSNIKMNFVSESGILMANSISNYNGVESITSLKGDTKVGNLEMNAQAKVATMDIKLINNDKEDISGAVILGRLPFEGNKTVASREELDSTFTAQLKSLINTNGFNATVYYSENGEANTDLQKLENRWMTEATTNVKSYLIVFNETFEKGQTVNFEYQITIPEYLGANEVTYSNYAVCYNNQTYDSPIVGIGTELVMLTRYRNQYRSQNGETTINSNNVVKGEDLVSARIEYYQDNTKDEYVGINSYLNYVVTITNKTNIEINNINITDALGDNVKFKEALVEFDNNEELSYTIPMYDSVNNNVTWCITNLPGKASISLIIKVSVKEYRSTGIINQCVISNNDNIYLTREKTIPMKSPAVITATMGTDLITDSPKENEAFNYNILVKNTGGDKATVDINSDIPEGLIINKASYILDGVSEEINISNPSKLELLSKTIGAGKSLRIVLEVQIQELPEDINKREIETFALITGNDVFVKTNSIKIIINKQQDSNDSDSVSTKKSISGFVWSDENKNGKRDTFETGIANINVKLFNTTGNETGQAKTDINGSYKLANLDNGKYIVMFEYDSKLYSVTVYKKDDVIETLNSDAKETVYKGNKVAMTDSIEIVDSSKTNINLGLIKNSIFDLKLDKYINTITVQNDQGVTTYNYTDTDFAKIELASKYIPSTTVVLEYKFVVTNQGDVPGYAKQIVDYLPQDLKFSSELNKQWYVNTDGNLYTSSLSDIIINPGETKEVNLIVTKKMTENNTGLVTNQAEIAESYNVQGIEEYDSIAANKNQNEDDIATASVIIGVKTGGVAFYLTITLICITIIAAGTYVINKKVLRGIK